MNPQYETTYNEERVEIIVKEITAEFKKASGKFDSFKNAHEGWAVLYEEVDELWDAVKLNQKNPLRAPQIWKECLHVAAMALWFLHDVAYTLEVPK